MIVPVGPPDPCPPILVFAPFAYSGNANRQGIVQDAWAMAHEDMAEMLRDREWERRKKRALQSMRKEYEDARRRELEEVPSDRSDPVVHVIANLTLPLLKSPSRFNDAYTSVAPIRKISSCEAIEMCMT